MGIACALTSEDMIYTTKNVDLVVTHATVNKVLSVETNDVSHVVFSARATGNISW